MRGGSGGVRVRQNLTLAFSSAVTVYALCTGVVSSVHRRVVRVGLVFAIQRWKTLSSLSYPVLAPSIEINDVQINVVLYLVVVGACLVYLRCIGCATTLFAGRSCFR